MQQGSEDPEIHYLISKPANLALVHRATRPRRELIEVTKREEFNAVFARIHSTVHQSIMRSAGTLAARRCNGCDVPRRPLPLLWRFSTQCATATCTTLPYAAAPANVASSGIAATLTAW